MGTLEITNDIDDSIDDELYQCLDLENPKSFFLFAGAGSGKTRSLVNVLRKVKAQHGVTLRTNKQQVAVITYTNAACGEILTRLEQDSLFSVTTIHSFVWELIKNYQSDIREWLREDLTKDIAELQEQLKKGRVGTKIAIDRENKIKSKTKRLAALNSIKRFTYNPNGNTSTRDSLNHSEVINITADFLIQKPLMQSILVNRFPILLIDESQDTKKELVDAFFAVQKNRSKSFSLGFYGDTMQRIYSDGKENLGQGLPDDWVKPVKRMNHRCPKRIITLINKIRESADKQIQVSRTDKEEGIVRFFLVPQNIENKNLVEDGVAKKMMEVTNDPLWVVPENEVKVLILEHHQAASRMGFSELFNKLYEVDRLRTSLLDGSLPELRFFTHLVFPVVKARRDGDEFKVARIVKQYSNYFDKARLSASDKQDLLISLAEKGVSSLVALWNDGENPTLQSILENVNQSGLFPVPEDLSIFIEKPQESKQAAESDKTIDDEEDSQDKELIAWNAVLQIPFTQIEAYESYISDKARFGTHQGVKGRQFPRVMVILDDEDSRGFLFSYDKMLGVKDLTDTDLKNIKEGRETSIDRTLRLFYVSCSRAEKSLAIIAYTPNPKVASEYVLAQGWFKKEEIEIVEN